MKWSLQTFLNGKYTRTVWLSQEGAIAQRESMLSPRTIKDSTSPTGKRQVIPVGWTAIRRITERGE